MKLIIDIPEGFYAYVKDHKDVFTKGLINGEKLGEAIAKGTPLKKGRWKRKPGSVLYHCSECGFSVTRRYDYCVCGAKMVEPQESD